MKEATGELNMTVITVAIIAGVLVIFTTVILPIIQSGLKRNAACAAAVGCSPCADGQMTCLDTNNNNAEIVCSCTKN